MKKFLAYSLLSLFLFSNCAIADEIPMLPINLEEKPSLQTQNSQSIFNHNNSFDNQNFYYNTCSCYGYNCWYSTTLTTNELRARGEAKRRARLEAKCKMNKARKSKCEELMED